MTAVNPPTTVWLDERVLAAMVPEANRCYAKETGGVLIGYWADNGDVVVTEASGPGPKAVYRRYRFRPDQAFQETFIAQQYEASGRRHVYLGDWHTHPDGLCGLSLRDKLTLWRISAYRAAHAPEPIMVVLGGNQDSWEPGVVRLRRNASAFGVHLESPFIRVYKGESKA